jgi:uncharacterized membrane protein HdeD (DUF308 family)
MSEATMTSEERLVPWWVVLIEGIAAIIIGILLLVNPRITTGVLIQFLGIYWFIVGIIDIVRIFLDSSMWGWKLFSGIIGILAGIAIIQYPLWASLLVPAVLVWVFGFLAVYFWHPGNRRWSCRTGDGFPVALASKIALDTTKPFPKEQSTLV